MEHQYDEWSSEQPRKRPRLGGNAASSNWQQQTDSDSEDGFSTPPYPTQEHRQLPARGFENRHPAFSAQEENGEQHNDEEAEEDAFDPPARPSHRQIGQPYSSKSKAANGIHRSVEIRHNLTGHTAESLSPRRHLCSGSKSSDELDEATKELEDLPSDAFSSPVSSPGREGIQQTVNGSRNLVNNASGLRQTTLLGRVRQSEATRGQEAPRQNGRSGPIRPDVPTHHQLERDKLNSWLYPVNIGTVRDYQYNIVHKALFHNLLVALPTGLGKTFIAATVMLNFYRWTSSAQIVFVAPTKPLVAQQVEACFGIAGIPRSDTSMLTGEIQPGIREEEWRTKRVFFMTPQTLVNDLKIGACDPKRVVCLVVDEAHRATGNYAYVEVVKFVRRFNQSFRILALTATPGSSVETVQQVIDGLDIARVAIRTEDSLDIRQYVHQRNIDTMVFEASADQEWMGEAFSKAVKPALNELNKANAYWVKDPLSLTPYGLMQARAQWMNSQVGRRANMGLKGKMNTIFTILASLAHSTSLLHYHGIVPFYQKLVEFRTEAEQTGKGSKYKKQILDHPEFRDLMQKAQQWTDNANFICHPKLEYLQDVILNHFLDAGERNDSNGQQSSRGTRIMVFVHFRDSAEEVVRVLKRNQPMVRPHVFVGQAASKGSAGMNQKAQLDVIKKFQDGTYNVLVATCIGEEGLDIGEVDLIVCYDSSASPIRMLQRMGRTGRKRAGNIVLLLMKGKEEDSFTKAKDNYEKMQEMISSGSRFNYHDELSSRILPRDAQPTVEKKVIEIPLENTQAELPVPSRRGRAPKRPKKKFNMPDGVQTGFVKASRVQEDEETVEQSLVGREGGAVELAPLENLVLSTQDQFEFERLYQNVYGGEGTQTISAPRLDAFSADLASPTFTKYVGHSKTTMDLLAGLRKMRDIDDEKLQLLEDNLHPEDKTMIQNSKDFQQPRRVASQRDQIQALSDKSSELDNRSNNDSTDDDLEGFIVNDEDDEGDETSSKTSVPGSGSKPRTPFYSASKRQRDSDSDDFPEIGSLFQLAEPSPTVDKNASGPLTTSASKRRRRVVSDSDSDL